MKSSKTLSPQEYATLLKFPAFISILAAFRDFKLDENEKKTAVKLAHAQILYCDPLLVEFYREADKVFENNLEQIDKDLPNEKESRKVAIKTALLKLENIALKLGNEYTSALNRSLNSFKEQVSKAHYNVISDFVLPITVLGLTDSKKNGDASET